MSTVPGAASAQSKIMAGLPTPDRTPEPHNRSKGKTREEVPSAASAQSKIMADLMTPDHTPEPQKKPSKKREEAPSVMQQRLQIPQNIRKNPHVSGPSSGASGGSFVQETPHTDVTTAELHPDAFNDDTSSLGDSDDKDPMEIDSKPPPDQFHLNMYNKATAYLFRLKDPISLQKISKINQKITMNNVKTEKPKTDYLIPLETITKTMSLYEQAKLDKDGVTMNVLAEIWQAQVERDTFPKEWEGLFSKTQQIQPSGDGGISYGGGIQLEDSEDVAHKGSIKTKAGVQIRDESDAQTLLGSVCFVKKRGFGSRVFVNCGTEEKPLYKVYPGRTFGAAAKKWLRDESFACDLLAPETPIREMRLMAWISAGLDQYYVVNVGNTAFLLTKTMLTKWLTLKQLEVYNLKIEYQMQAMEAELTDYRNSHMHPDTGKRLTSKNIQDMPWLSNGDPNEDEESEEET